MSCCLAALASRALRTELGEVLAAAAVEGVARGPEPLPQRLLGGAVDVRGRLPLLEQLAQPLAGGLPLGGDGERLGVGHDPLAQRAGRRSGELLAGGARLRPALVDRRARAASSRARSAVEVADRGRLGEELAQPRAGWPTPRPARPPAAGTRRSNSSTSSTRASYLRV